MSLSEINLFREAMQELDGYNVFSKEKKIFGFETFRQQKQNPLTIIRKEKQICKIVPSIEEQEIVNNQNNFYEKLSLVNCKVNIFAMKKFIRNNIKSLREIYIEECSFYSSDEDAQKNRNQEKNQRMFQEIDFIWLIEQFKFRDIQTISIKLSEDPSQLITVQQKKPKQNSKQKLAKVMTLNHPQSPQEIRNTEEKTELEEDYQLTNEQFNFILYKQFIINSLIGYNNLQQKLLL